MMSQSFNRIMYGLDGDSAAKMEMPWHRREIWRYLLKLCRSRARIAMKGERGVSLKARDLQNTNLKDICIKAEDKRQSRCDIAEVGDQVRKSTSTIVIPAIDSAIPIAKTITSKICLPAWISKMVATVLFSHDVRTSAECQACLRHPFQNHNHYSAYILRSAKSVPLFQRPVWSASLSLPPTFLSIFSRKPRVLAKVRDVFSPTSNSSCVSRVLYHSSSWDPLGTALRGRALLVLRGGSLLFLRATRIVSQDLGVCWTNGDKRHARKIWQDGLAVVCKADGLNAGLWVLRGDDESHRKVGWM